jgi:dihydrofolate reductase
MRELIIDFITSLDGYASAEGWPGFWGLEGPEYLAWLGQQPEVTYVMGANTYRLMSGFAAGETPAGTDEFTADEKASVDGLTRAPKVVFSASLEEPLAWANTTLVRDDAVEAVRAMKGDGSGLISTIGSLSLCRSLLRAGLVDRFRVVMFPVITGATGAERIYDGYPDVALEMIDNLRRPHPAGRVPAPRTGAPTTRPDRMRSHGAGWTRAGRLTAGPTWGRTTASATGCGASGFGPPVRCWVKAGPNGRPTSFPSGLATAPGTGRD